MFAISLLGLLGVVACVYEGAPPGPAQTDSFIAKDIVDQDGGPPRICMEDLEGQYEGTERISYSPLIYHPENQIRFTIKRRPGNQESSQKYLILTITDRVFSSEGKIADNPSVGVPGDDVFMGRIKRVIQSDVDDICVEMDEKVYLTEDEETVRYTFNDGYCTFNYWIQLETITFSYRVYFSDSLRYTSYFTVSKVSDTVE